MKLYCFLLLLGASCAETTAAWRDRMREEFQTVFDENNGIVPQATAFIVAVADPLGDWRGHGGDSFGFASLAMRSDLHNASFAAVSNTCNLPEINTAALKKFNADLEARAAATEAPTAQTMEPTAAPESDAVGRMSPAVGAVALLALVV